MAYNRKMSEERLFFTFDGLHGSGKSTILRLVSEELECRVVAVTTPRLLKPVRNALKDVGADLLNYSLLNLLADRIIVKRALDQNQIVLQDRSWLSTLYSHEQNGTSRRWMNFGESIAHSCLSPNIAFIIHSDSEVRRQRLALRGRLDKADIASLNGDVENILGYKKWAEKLGWNCEHYDNSGADEVIAKDYIIRRIKTTI